MSIWRRSCRTWLLVVLAAVSSPVLCYESGAPDTSCGSMFPGHGIEQQESEPPYSLGVVKTKGENGDVVVVTILSPPDTNFLGFFLQARDANNKSRILPGTFSTPPDTRRQSCPPESQNTLTHANKNPKGNLTTVWSPPPNFDGQVIFRATVAEKFEMFWMDLETVPLKIKSGNVQYGVEEASQAPLEPYDSCGDSSGCYGLPEGCPKTKSCDILLKYSLDTDGINFQILGMGQNDINSYVAVGLSTDTVMGDDSVVGCIRRGSDDVIVQPSWNVGPTPRHGNNALLDGNQGISASSGEFRDGLLSCKWKRDFTTTVQGHTFDLKANSYHLMLSKGPASANNLKFHTSKEVSSEKKNLTVNEVDGSNVIPSDSYKSCGVTAGCAGMPEGCVDNGQNCQLLVSYVPAKDGVDFQIVGSVQGGSSYIAVGLSFDKDMGNDSVVGCIYKDSGEVVVQPSWNPAHYNKALLDGDYGISQGSGNYNDGILTCKWKRQLKTEIEQYTFDMATTAFHLLLAKGPSRDINLRKHTMVLGSKESVNLTNPDIDNLPPHNTYESCGVTAGCFGKPEGCLDRKNCEILLSYSPSRNGVDFQLVGTRASEDNYIAIGLSEDQSMGDDSVTGCIHQKSGVIVQPSWNLPRHANKALLNGSQGISQASGEYNDGVLTCRWKRQLTTNIEGITFNLSSTMYYLFLAEGPSTGRNLRQHTSHQISNEKANLTETRIIAGKPNYLVKIHGAFMVAAWVGFVSVAILVARHYKNVWENDTLCTLKVWFAIHRTLMMSAVSLIIAAFVCIFIHVDGWSRVANPHPILGCVCTGLAVIQPIMALFRPSPTASNRYIFNWLHWSVGNSAQIIAVVTMFYAVDLSAVNLGFGFYYVLISFVGFHFCFHIVMQIHTYAMEKKGQFQVHNVMQMHDLGQKQAQEFTKDAPGSGFRRFMLGIYIVINAGIVTALVLLVVLQ